MRESNRLAREIGFFGPMPEVEEAAEPFDLSKIDLFSPPSPSRKYNTVLPRDTGVIHHLPAAANRSREPVWYISDFHLEFQMEERGIEHTEAALVEFIDGRAAEMLADTPDRTGVLLCGGDVSHSVALTTLFYDRLCRLWQGPVLAVVGNHELWDNQPHGTEHPRGMGEILADYRRHIDRGGTEDLRRAMLEDDVYVRFPDGRGRRIREEQLLAASDEDLQEVLHEASLVVLGGNGFTGLNPRYNASLGMYRDTLTDVEEDRALSLRFQAVYNKLRRLVGDEPVVVFTHTPTKNWSAEDYDPRWVYISGHTHQNKLMRRGDGVTVLSDNQIGYTDRKWYLCGFSFDE